MTRVFVKTFTANESYFYGNPFRQKIDVCRNWGNFKIHGLTFKQNDLFTPTKRENDNHALSENYWWFKVSAIWSKFVWSKIG